MPELEEVTALYKSLNKAYVHGPFGAFKKREVDAAMLDDTLRTAVDHTGKIIASLVVQRAKSTSSIKDFAGRSLGNVFKGTLRISAMAAQPGFEPEVLRMVLELVEHERIVWLELYQECQWQIDVAEHAGFVWAGTKITAYSDMIGVWVRGDEPLAYPKEELVTLAKLNLPLFNNLTFLAERVRRTVAEWNNHYSIYNKGNSWSAISLRGYDEDPMYIQKPSEMSKQWKLDNPDELSKTLTDTSLRHAFPEAEPIIDAIPGEKHRIRFMRLRAGDGELTRHVDITDPDAGVAPGKILRIHVPIVTNEGVRFHQWMLDGHECSVHMRQGETWYLDTRKPHLAYNKGEAERIHLVMDVESNPALLGLLGEHAPMIGR